MDLHLHTPASADWQEPEISFLEWLQKCESRGLDIVAITDHNTVEGIARLRAEIERLTWLEANDRLRPQERRDLDEYRRIGDKVLVLPGFEFTATFGFHVLGIFPPETPLRALELLLLRLNVPVNRLADGSTEIGASTDVLTAYRTIREAGGLVVAAHVNSTHGVANRGVSSLGGQTKIAYTQDPNLHALEVTDLEDASRRATARFFDGVKPEYPRRMHCIQGSDAHRMTRDPRDKTRTGIGDRVTEFLLSEASFEGLREVLEEDDFSRTRPYRPMAETPFDHIQAAREQGNTIVQSFHESMARQGGQLHKVLCDAVAFGNTRGGAIYVGLSAARKGQPRGLDNAPDEANFLRREIERHVTPPLDAKVDVVETLGASIVRVLVPNGADKPYALDQTRVYVRQEGETNEAVRDELVQLVLAGRAVQAEPTVQVSAPQAAAEPVALQPAAVKPGALAPGAVLAAEPGVEEEVVPVAEPAPAKRRSSSRGRGRGRGRAVAAETVSAETTEEPAPVPEPEPAEPEEEVALPAEALEPQSEFPTPAIGVEIVSMEDRKGTKYFHIRDLRNGNTVQNVTPASARKLWSYAINQAATNPVDPTRVTWSGSLGLWQVAKRAKKLRYDLVLREPDGHLRIFYGVTADGMSGPWVQFLKEEDRA